MLLRSLACSQSVDTMCLIAACGTPGGADNTQTRHVVAQQPASDVACSAAQRTTMALGAQLCKVARAGDCDVAPVMPTAACDVATIGASSLHAPRRVEPTALARLAQHVHARCRACPCLFELKRTRAPACTRTHARIRVCECVGMCERACARVCLCVCLRVCASSDAVERARLMACRGACGIGGRTEPVAAAHRHGAAVERGRPLLRAARIRRRHVRERRHGCVVRQSARTHARGVHARTHMRATTNVSVLCARAHARTRARTQGWDGQRRRRRQQRRTSAMPTGTARLRSPAWQMRPAGGTTRATARRPGTPPSRLTRTLARTHIATRQTHARERTPTDRPRPTVVMRATGSGTTAPRASPTARCC